MVKKSEPSLRKMRTDSCLPFQSFLPLNWKLQAWSAKRELSKINYRIHADAIKSNLIPAEVTREQATMKYAESPPRLLSLFSRIFREKQLRIARGYLLNQKLFVNLQHGNSI